MVLASPTTAPTGWTGWFRQRLDSLAPSVLTFILASTVLILGWAGVDQAAQTYRTLQYQLHGLMLWDSGWYAGNFPLGYSVLFPVVAGTFGIKVVAVASAVVATWSFDRVIRTYFGARPLGTWYFAVSTLLPVTIGQWPFLAGEASGLLALLSLQKGRRPLALVLGVLSALFSPLAAAFLAMGCLAWAAYSSRRWWMVATAGASLIVILLIGVLFPGIGPFPFPWTGLVPSELLCLCALTPLVQTTPAVRLGALFYAAASLFSYLVPNPLGGNAPRLAASVGVPLLACFLTVPGPAYDRLSHSELVRRVAARAHWRAVSLPERWRYLALLLVVPFAIWQWAPWDGVVTSRQAAPYTQASFYQPLVSALQAASLQPVRVEIPPTIDHWESAFVAPYVSVARGWERQLDIADNPLFYTPAALAGTLSASDYLQWLDAEGVSYVALPTAPLDYAAKAEGALLRSGQVPHLSLVWTNPEWKLWKVDSSPGLVSGPAVLTSLEPDHLVLQANRPGTITVRVRWTNFWTVTSGNACVGAAPSATRAGRPSATGVASSPVAPAAGARSSGPSASGPGGHTSSQPYQWTSVTALSAGTIDLSASVLHPTAPAACPSS
ncbi:MAG: hypothetical protein M0Z30_07875 [Actinomycetota bacterium]|nr:hypothetical protein [Actinomycetota bacterium]